jgi:hypothetical protein
VPDFRHWGLMKNWRNVFFLESSPLMTAGKIFSPIMLNLRDEEVEHLTSGEL